MSGYRQVKQSACVADAVSMAFGALEELAGECREIVDGASEGLSQTQRIQTLDETASQLEGLSEPEVPDLLGQQRIEYVEATKSRGVSRAARRDNAVSALQAVVECLEERLADLEEKLKDGRAVTKVSTDNVEGEIATVEGLRDECQSAIDEAEGCEFPGMYG